MKNVTANLLHWSWYTTRFLGLIEQKRRSEEKINVREIEKQYLEQLKKEGSLKNQDEMPIINPGYLIMFSYAILVLPKELMKKKNLRGSGFSFDSKEEFQFINPKHSSSIEPDKFLTKMRNSIAHVHFKLEAENNIGPSRFTFWDEYNGKENFRVTTTKDGFWKFLNEAGKYYSSKIADIS